MLIETEFQQTPFVAVPRDVVALLSKKGADGRPVLSAEALGALVWLAARPQGAQVSVASLRRSLALGKDKWQRIRRELSAVGAVQAAPLVCNETGRLFGSGMLVRWPVAAKPEGRETRLSGASGGENPRGGKPGSRAGKPGSVGPGNPAPSYRSKEGAQGRPPLQAGGAPARPASEPGTPDAGPLGSASGGAGAGEMAPAQAAAPVAVPSARAAWARVVSAFRVMPRAETFICPATREHVPSRLFAAMAREAGFGEFADEVERLRLESIAGGA